jgi:bacterioferritin-associated ferredoxin
MKDDQMVVCRCEDITVEEVKQAIANGATNLEELKRMLRVGMGSCQGRTCGSILISMLARALNKKPSEIKEWTKRPPLKPVQSRIFIQGEKK